jgi:hypothetical protein
VGDHRFHLGRTVSNRDCDVSGEVDVFVSANSNRIAIRGSSDIVDYTANTVYGARIGGLYTLYVNTTSLVFSTTGIGGFSGRITVYALTP